MYFTKPTFFISILILAVSFGVGSIFNIAFTNVERTPIGPYVLKSFVKKSVITELRNLANKRAPFRTFLGFEHFKAGTISLAIIKRRAPRVFKYYTEDMADVISNAIGVDDLLSISRAAGCMLIFYDQPGNHVGWHYDSDTFGGTMINVLSYVNITDDNCSHFEWKRNANSKPISIHLQPGQSIAYEGPTVLHRVTPQCEGKRIVWNTIFVAGGYRPNIWHRWLNLLYDVGYNGKCAFQSLC